MKKIEDILKFLGIYCIVACVWGILEYTFYGGVQFRICDDIIGAVLSLSLLFNYKLLTDKWRKK